MDIRSTFSRLVSSLPLFHHKPSVIEKVAERRRREAEDIVGASKESDALDFAPVSRPSSGWTAPVSHPEHAPVKRPKRDGKSVVLAVSAAVSLAIGAGGFHFWQKTSELEKDAARLSVENTQLKQKNQNISGRFPKSDEVVVPVEKIRDAVAYAELLKSEKAWLDARIVELEAETAALRAKLGKSDPSAKKALERPVENPAKIRPSATKRQAQTSSLVWALLSRVNADLPENLTVFAEPSDEGTRIVLYERASGPKRYYTLEKPGNAERRTYEGIRDWAVGT